LNVKKDVHKFENMWKDACARAAKPGHSCNFPELFHGLGIDRLGQALAGTRAAGLEIKKLSQSILDGIEKVVAQAFKERVVVHADLASVAAAARARKRPRLSGGPAQLMLTAPNAGEGGPPVVAASPVVAAAEVASSVVAAAGIVESGSRTPVNAEVASPVLEEEDAVTEEATED
jgi:hypothetical protein